MTPLFRWDGVYWGFLVENQLYDRYGRHAGWIEPAPDCDVFDITGRFLGQFLEGHYVLRSTFRAEPVHRAPRPAVPHPAPVAPPPDRDAREPRDGWSDALPWPLPPPDPPRV